MVLQIVVVKAIDYTITTDLAVVFRSELFEVFTNTNISNYLKKIYKQLLSFIDVYECIGSGLVLSSLQSLEIIAWSLDPLRASAHHKLPAWIESKNAVTNVRKSRIRVLQMGIPDWYAPTKGTPIKIIKLSAV